MGNELSRGIERGLASLGQGIAQRWKNRADVEMQEQSAKALNDYLKTGVINPALLSVPGATQAIFGQIKQPEQMSEYQRESLNQRKTEFDAEQKKTKQDTSVTPYEDFRQQYTVDGKVDYPALTKAWTQSQIDIYGSKKDIDVKTRPDKSQTVKGMGADGKEKYISIFTDPNTNEVTFKETGVATVPKPAAASKAAQERANSLTAFEQGFDVYMENLNKVDSGRIGGTAANIQAMVGANDPAKLVGDFKDGLARFVGRQLFGETRMTDEDVVQLRKTLPDPTDTKSERKLKEKTLRGLIQNAKAAVGGTGSGKMSKDAFIKDFQGEEGRPPTEEELERLKQMGEWE
jgi:hypothetical protein